MKKKHFKEVLKSIDQAREIKTTRDFIESVAKSLHKWYSGYEIENCPNGYTCGLYQSCLEEAKKLNVLVEKLYGPKPTKSPKRSQGKKRPKTRNKE